MKNLQKTVIYPVYFNKTLDKYQGKVALLEEILENEENLHGKKIIQNVTILKSKQVCFFTNAHC